MLYAERRGRQLRRGRSMLERYQVWGQEFRQAEDAPRSVAIQRSTAEIPQAMARYHDIKHFTHGAHTGL
jgi:hypothetical protein